MLKLKKNVLKIIKEAMPKIVIYFLWELIILSKKSRKKYGKYKLHLLFYFEK